MSNATAKKSPRAGRDVRRQVLDAALRLFTRDGYFKTSVHDVARTSGVSVGSIYHHFNDKEGIARALYADLAERMVELLEGIHRDYASTHDRCRAVVAALFDMTENEPEAMEFMLYAKHREFLPDETPVCSSRAFEMMRMFVAEGMSSGEIQTLDPMVASTCLFGGAIRMITARLDGVVTKPLTAYLDQVWACSWRSIAN